MPSPLSSTAFLCFRRAAVAALFVVGVARAAQAQAPADVSQEKSFVTTFDANTLASLPLGENVYALIETTQSELISDRFSSGGLNVGEGNRVGGFLGSWSQTRYRIGDIDITDPSGRGGALMFPELLPWQRISIGTGMFGADTIAPGLSVDLFPSDAAEKWTTTIHATGSGGGLASSSPDATLANPIARLKSFAHGSGVVSGTTASGMGVTAGAAFSTADKFVREAATRTSHVTSGFVNLSASPSPDTHLRAFGWVQSSTRKFGSAADVTNFVVPPGDDTSAHVQASAEQKRSSGTTWRASLGYTQQAHDNTLQTSNAALDRVIYGPIPTLLSTISDNRTRRLQLVGRLTPHMAAESKHRVEYGIDIGHDRMRSSNYFSGIVGEYIAGTSTRAYQFTSPGTDSNRQRTAAAVFASDRITISNALAVDASLRLETVRGRAAGATTGVSWLSALPRVAMRWKVTDLAQLSMVAGYRRAANQLNLDTLAWGDPGAPTIGAYRWNGTFGPSGATLGTFTDRLGPGAGGNPAFSQIDPDLKRPYTDEFVFGFESDREGWLKWGLMGIGRIESNIIGVTDVGVPLSAYAQGTVLDPGQVLNDPFDDQQLTVYNRLPATFGQNQLLLTNPDVQSARSFALKLTAQAKGERFTSLWVATASLAQGSAGNRGFGPLENDQDVIGELFTNPNATGFARGRLFADRAFTIKWTTVYKLPGDIDFGAIARYQDGQPMSRFVLATSLNQGNEILLAYPNASHRFTFTGTLDLRVKKGITLGTKRADVILDAYNLITRSNEVEEDPFTGPAFRTPTAIEPPASVHVGLKFTF